MINIRSYELKDRGFVENICSERSDPMRKTLLTCFCNYYIEREPQNCFVAVDEVDKCIGYVLCAADFYVWERVFKEEYYGKSQDPMTKGMGEGTVEGLKHFAKEYPAHLHIDIAEDYQRQGIGTKLIDELIKHLRKKSVKGLMFSVAIDNEKGLGFYRKYGFKELGRDEREIFMGLEME